MIISVPKSWNLSQRSLVSRWHSVLSSSMQLQASLVVSLLDMTGVSASRISESSPESEFDPLSENCNFLPFRIRLRSASLSDPQPSTSTSTSSEVSSSSSSCSSCSHSCSSSSSSSSSSSLARFLSGSGFRWSGVGGKDIDSLSAEMRKILVNYGCRSRYANPRPFSVRARFCC